jgi:uncharacterized protein (TIGR02466 family)
VSDQIKPIFPTTLFTRHIAGMDETNRALAALILDIEASDTNSAKGTSTKGGFQTADTLLSTHPRANDPALVTLKRHIAGAIQSYAGLLIEQECSRKPAQVKYDSWGWGVILRRGNWQGHHVHPDAHISGVYYVSAPPVALEDGNDAGKISFFDPRPRANMAQLPAQVTRYWEAPVPGDMVIFPSWLEHSVAPFEGEGMRICIAFNVRLLMS